MWNLCSLIKSAKITDRGFYLWDLLLDGIKLKMKLLYRILICWQALRVKSLLRKRNSHRNWWDSETTWNFWAYATTQVTRLGVEIEKTGFSPGFVHYLG